MGTKWNSRIKGQETVKTLSPRTVAVHHRLPIRALETTLTVTEKSNDPAVGRLTMLEDFPSPLPNAVQAVHSSHINPVGDLWTVEELRDQGHNMCRLHNPAEAPQ
eukprot:GHVN01078561.1.p3 GENE.GHVN01078561.1~~GHVN01078561.1.p3  ORF type:complete len:105 (+),score=8.87 GHVN01078561.1:826-1140(+)